MESCRHIHVVLVAINEWQDQPAHYSFEVDRQAKQQTLAQSSKPKKRLPSHESLIHESLTL